MSKLILWNIDYSFVKLLRKTLECQNHICQASSVAETVFKCEIVCSLDCNSLVLRVFLSQLDEYMICIFSSNGDYVKGLD